MLKKYMEQLIDGKNIKRVEAMQAIIQILEGSNSCQTAAFLALMRAKKETPEEILGAVDAMRSKMVKLNLNFPVLDIVGTGGDHASTINISTGAGILAASCGVKVAKHGNRSVSSQCGSADALEALGVDINCDPQNTVECIQAIGFGFCFAPVYHPVLTKVKEIRKDLGIPTIFNLIGPLLNPAYAEYLMIGALSRESAQLLASAVEKLLTDNDQTALSKYPKKVLIFHSAGLDELTSLAPANVIDITRYCKKEYILDPKYYGFNVCNIKDLRGGTPDQNAKLLREVFEGKQGAIADTLIFNAAVALYVYGKTKSVEEAINIAKGKLNNGDASKTLNKLVDLTCKEKV